ncbi:ABC transporter substrate-binding protein [Paenisporosarcina sp. TG-14]|uniref:ABC transporter substrate-binding protein n=1 Tax=Paenisporosarcina sp. TG-14 TaxID=1231057 RepID=UPI0002F6C592|nr:ABC transporter substrate-binding protein [Paenisporosarcina sp. TG-14]
MKKKFHFLLILASAFFIAACSPGQQSNESSSESGKEDGKKVVNEDSTVIVGIASPILTLDPANSRDRVTESVLRNVFDGLVTRAPDGTVEPQIAESWDNPTPTEWTFTIREGIKFHDGTPLTIEDVVFTFERIINEGSINGETSPRKGLLGPLTKVEKVDEVTVKFTLEEPWPIIIQMLPHQQIVPKAYIEEVGDEDFAKNPIGAGPFMVKSASLDERIELERFDDYYGGKQAIKTLVFDVIPENSSRIAALQSGAVQRIQGVPPVLVSQLEQQDDLEVKTANGTRVYMIEMNTNKPPFDNEKVRQAMNYAVNMDEIVETMLEGYGSRLAGPLLQEAFGLNEDLKPYEYNPEKAKQLLTEAGYADGFSVVIDAKDTQSEVVQAVAAQLREVGVDAQIRVWDWGVLGPLIENGERLMYMTDWGNSTQDPYDFLNPKLITEDRGNFSFYSNKRVDELLNDASIELDVDKRKDMYYEAQEIIYDEAPWIFGYSMFEIEAGVKNLKNWEPATDSMLKMHDVYLE